ncbi:MAG: aminotransferase class I/II-fold pyridoxal phosphate-dependent enzyme [Pseudomonadota bacterium]
MQAFASHELGPLGAQLVAQIEQAYRAVRPFPPEEAGALPAIPRQGLGMDALPALWRAMVERSAHLGSPWMSGHMDTAPHPAAALTQALLAALNNNLLFRELSPMASAAEEQLIGFFRDALGLGADWNGLFASGGSLANMNCLFAATGGFAGVERRAQQHILAPESAHVSVAKSAAVLGIPAARVHRIACDAGGHAELPALEDTLRSLPAAAIPIVVSMLGTVIHGAVDRIDAVADICERHRAWHHVDAVYGAGLCASTQHRALLRGLDRADSIALGPQKWMYVPRLCAVAMVRGRQRFDGALGTALPYSLGQSQHRGQWGLQGSRPADALLLWTVLQVVGTEALGAQVDRSIGLAGTLHTRLAGSARLEPAHAPDLNIQTLRLRGGDPDGSRTLRVQQLLAERGKTWLSVSRWKDESLLRAVLLSPALTPQHLEAMVAEVEQACADAPA